MATRVRWQGKMEWGCSGTKFGTVSDFVYERLTDEAAARDGAIESTMANVAESQLMIARLLEWFVENDRMTIDDVNTLFPSERFGRAMLTYEASEPTA